MPILARRYVELDIETPPTLEDAIRGVISPVQSNSASITFTIPSWVQAGDLILIYVYNRTYASFAKKTTGSGVSEPVAGWTRWWHHSDYAADISPYPTLTIEFPGSTWDEFYHVAASGDAGTNVTFEYVRYDFYSASYVPVTFGNPIVCGVVFKADWNANDGNYGGVGYDYDYDDAAVAYSSPYQVVLYFNGLYAGGSETPVLGATTLCKFSSDSSVFLAAKMAYGSGSESYHIQAGKIGLWMIEALVPA